jgi:FolB domain-containing protein
MTLIIASVTGASEAEGALACGVDIIEVRDASDAAFGAASPDVVRATAAVVRGRRPLSAVVGELPMEPAAIVTAATAMAETGADYIEVGLFPGEKRADCIRALASLARRSKLFGVLFADDGADQSLIPLMAESGFAGVMLDTALKTSGGLLDLMNIAALAKFVDAAHSKGLLAGLAGLLEAPDIPRLLLAAPDILALRGALSTGSAIDEVRALMSPDVRGLANDRAAASKVDYRLLAARGTWTDPHKDQDTDRVFVHDFVLPIQVGTYARERNKPQNVRFNVDLRVLRASHAPEDMRDVFSYDIITDSIRMIVGKEHIALVEMLAERIAAVMLTHPRVVSATVRIEKLGVGPGTVGVEITRERPAEGAEVRHLFPLAAADSDPKAT